MLNKLNPLAGYKITANVPGCVQVSKDGVQVKVFRNFYQASRYCDRMNKK